MKQRFHTLLQHHGIRRYAVLALLVLAVLCGCAKKPATASPGTTGTTAAAASSEASTQAATADSDHDAADAAGASSETSTQAGPDAAGGSVLDENGTYTSGDDVALYLHTYGRLPSNFITKNDAKAKGWDPSKGNLHEVLPGMSIGGDRFGNREGLLPEKKGRRYYECDIDYTGGSRNAKRIVYSDDGLIFYTEDHYASFVQLY